MTPAAKRPKAGSIQGRARSRARELALRALYQRELTGQTVQAILTQLEQRGEMQPDDESEPGDALGGPDSGEVAAYYRALLVGIGKTAEAIDARIAGYADRPVARLDPVEHAILLIGLYELEMRDDVPYRVVLNEAVELAHRYGAQDGHRFVNAILDRAARALRPDELAAAK